MISEIFLLYKEFELTERRRLWSDDLVIAQSTSDQQILSGWGLTAFCEPIHLGGGSRRQMANTRRRAGSNPQPSVWRASAVTTAPPCAPEYKVDKDIENEVDEDENVKNEDEDVENKNDEIEDDQDNENKRRMRMRRMRMTRMKMIRMT